jgi:hypothetical protein
MLWATKLMPSAARPDAAPTAVAITTSQSSLARIWPRKAANADRIGRR